jgi:Post-segregation antitoxin CcdA
MDAFKREQASGRQKVRLDGPQTNEDAANWWANWARDHSEQIAAYNKDVAENGVWSDGLRTF